MSVSLSFEWATEADFTYFVDLNERCYIDVATLQFGAWDSAMQAARYRDKWQTQAFRKIYADGELAGGVWTIDHGDSIQLREIQVDPDFQGRGIGGAVLQVVIDEAGGKPLWLRVLHLNRAIALYERMGFVIREKDETQYVMDFSPESA